MPELFKVIELFRKRANNSWIWTNDRQGAYGHNIVKVDTWPPAAPYGGHELYSSETMINYWCRFSDAARANDMFEDDSNHVLGNLHTTLQHGN